MNATKTAYKKKIFKKYVCANTIRLYYVCNKLLSENYFSKKH